MYTVCAQPWRKKFVSYSRIELSTCSHQVISRRIPTTWRLCLIRSSLTSLHLMNGRSSDTYSYSPSICNNATLNDGETMRKNCNNACLHFRALFSVRLVFFGTTLQLRLLEGCALGVCPVNLAVAATVTVVQLQAQV